MIIVAILAILVVTPILIIIAAGCGFLIGHAVAWLAAPALTGVFGISADNIPQIFAWLFVLSALGFAGKAAGTKSDD